MLMVSSSATAVPMATSTVAAAVQTKPKATLTIPFVKGNTFCLTKSDAAAAAILPLLLPPPRFPKVAKLPLPPQGCHHHRHHRRRAAMPPSLLQTLRS